MTKNEQPKTTTLSNTPKRTTRNQQANQNQMDRTHKPSNPTTIPEKTILQFFLTTGEKIYEMYNL